MNVAASSPYTFLGPSGSAFLQLAYQTLHTL